MALDDFTDIDDETLGGLGDLFDEPLTDVAAAEDVDDAEEREEPLAATPAATPAATSAATELDGAHFLDDAAIDEELLSSVEDVLSELDDLDQSDEELFGLQELGVPERSARGGGQGTARESAFPAIHPVESLGDTDGDEDDGERYGEPLSDHFTAPARGGWLPTLAILAANLLLLLFAWNASRSLQSSLRDVRDELDDVRAAALAPRATRGEAVAQGPASTTRVGRAATLAETAQDAAQLPTFDQIAFEIAQRELERGLYTSARRRLYAVLALADRIEPERRGQVEAHMIFLIADSYRNEAELRREVAQ